MLAKRPQPVEYPTGDGKPMAETDAHRQQMVELIDRLEHHYRDRADVYVSGDLLMFYEEGNRRKHRSPDVLVVFGVPKKRRLHYLVWAEQKAPDIVFEITSSSTRTEDTGPKKTLYAQLGVKELVLFDPFGDYLKPRLQLFRLERGTYVPVVGIPLVSQVLGMELRLVGDSVHLYDATTGILIPTLAEAAQARAEAAQAKAEAAQARAEAAQAMADAAQARAEAAEQELEKLRRLL